MYKTYPDVKSLTSMLKTLYKLLTAHNMKHHLLPQLYNFVVLQKQLGLIYSPPDQLNFNENATALSSYIINIRDRAYALLKLIRIRKPQKVFAQDRLE